MCFQPAKYWNILKDNCLQEISPEPHRILSISQFLSLIMKKYFCFALILFAGVTATCGQFLLQLETNGAWLPQANWSYIPSFQAEFNKFWIKTAASDEKTYKVFFEGENTELNAFAGDGAAHSIVITSTGDIRGKKVCIGETLGKCDASFVIPKPPSTGDEQDTGDEDDPDKNTVYTNELAYDALQGMFPEIEINRYGIVIPEDAPGNTAFKGKHYIHIFFDENGESLLQAIPPGIPGMQYVVHILYAKNTTDNTPAFRIRQTKSSFNPRVVFESNVLELKSGAITPDNAAQFVWECEELLLSASTGDIEFEIEKTTGDKKGSLGKYTIKMVNVYQGAFNVGLLNTRLANPSFELLPSAGNPNDKVVKRNLDEDRGVVTLMATWYFSPVVFLKRKLFQKDIPEIRQYERNYLYDHSLFERIYPTVGVSVSEKVVENLFAGFNWEFARGGALYFGWHFGKVNYFVHDESFKFEETPVTEADFNLRTKQRWCSAFAFGLNIDLKILANLTGTAGKN
jgi:hypothetical protein